jgi:hypothetical protein
MKQIYLDCSMGAAGDMLMAALLELYEDKKKFIERLNGLNITNVKITAAQSVKCGITGTHIDVKVGGASETSHDVNLACAHEHTHEKHSHEHDRAHTHEKCSHDHEPDEHIHEHSHTHAHAHTHHHEHRGMAEIAAIIDALALPDAVKTAVKAVYKIIAEAESAVHGREISEVHFHEVGSMDAIADITGVCWLIHELSPQKIAASPINVGSGHVKCAHGILPVPAPATAHILKGVPIYSSAIQGELCTPTGAALLKYFAAEFKPMPVMRLEKIGYGMGQKDFPAANCVRALLGETDEATGKIIELCCNLDDMTGEEIAFAAKILLKEGALDAYTVPIQMKKGRQGTLLACLCKPVEKEKFAKLIFKHTSTIGVRFHEFDRYELSRRTIIKESKYGNISVKASEGYGCIKMKAEHDDLAGIAIRENMSIDEVKRKIFTEN